MAKTLIEKILKKFKSVSRESVQSEIATLESTMPLVASGYHPHCVNVGSENYTAYDAKAINRALNQTGRGDYRYLAQKRTIVGIAVHRRSGNSYRRVA